MYYFKFIKKLVWSKQVVHMIIRYYFIGRLEAYDRNKNFKEDPILLPEPLDVGWPVAGFKQILQEHKCIIPKITREQIEAYFLYRLAGIQFISYIGMLLKTEEFIKSERSTYNTIEALLCFAQA